MMKRLNRKLIKREITVLHFFALLLSKLLIGIGIGMILASYFWFSYPVMFLFIILGGLILIPYLIFYLKEDEDEEKKLKHMLHPTHKK